MADTDNDLKKRIDDLEKEVTCGICQKLYREPKFLPCSHCFCKQCIAQLCCEKNWDPITCPECQTVHKISQNTIGGLKTAFNVNRLVELHRDLLNAYKKERAKLPTESEAPSSKCSKHGDFRLLYCYSCKTLICRDCAIFEHRKHKHEYNSTAVPKRKKELLHFKEIFVEVNKDFQDALEKVKKATEAIKCQGHRVAKHLSSYFKHLHEILHKQETTLLEKNEGILRQKLNQLKAQEENLSFSCDELCNVVKQIDQHLPSNNCEVVMSSDMMDMIEIRKKKFRDKEDDENDLFLPFFSQEKYINHELVPSVRTYVEVETKLPASFLPYSKELVEFVHRKINSIPGIVVDTYEASVLPDQKYSFKFLFETEGDFEAYIFTLPPDAHKMRKCDVNKIGSVTYRVDYISPIIPAKYHINILLAGKHVAGSGLPLKVQEIEHDLF